MKKIFYFTFIFLICALTLAPVFSLGGNAVYAEDLGYEPIIEASIEPDIIYDNKEYLENEYTIYNQGEKSFDFVLSDKYVDFEFNGAKGFTTINPFAKVVFFEEYSSDPYVAKPVYYQSADVGSVETIGNRIELLSVGSCYLYYKGSFQVFNGYDEAYFYWFTGRILIRVVDYDISIISYSKTQEMVEENTSCDVYTAVLNNNPNLTKYNREKLEWTTNNYSTRGNIFYNYAEVNDVSNDFLTLKYDNNSWLEESEREGYPSIELKVFDNSTGIVQDGNTPNRFWWAIDLGIIALIALLLFLFSKMKEDTSLVATKIHLLDFIEGINILNELVNKDFKNEKAKQKKIDRQLKQCAYHLLFAKQSCATAIKEDYYELAPCVDKIEQIFSKYTTLVKSKSKIDNQKMLKSCLIFVKNISPSLELIEATISYQAKIEEKIIKAREMENAKFAKVKTKKKKISADEILAEVEDEIEHSQEQDKEQNLNTNDEIIASAVMANLLMSQDDIDDESK